LREKLTLAERRAKQQEASPPGVSVFGPNYGQINGHRNLLFAVVAAQEIGKGR